MGRSVVLGALLLLLLVANVSFTQAQTVKYIRVGGTLQLSPQPVSEQIYSVVWKYGRNLLAEWVKDQIPLTYYSKFKGRTTLNTNTGMLETSNMTVEDSGLYSVEINNQVQSRVHKIMAIEDVPEPVLEVKPLACGLASENCKVVCGGDVSKAGPVEYFWKKGEEEWATSKENTVEIINDETKRVKTFSCRIKNQFSEKESNALENPFYREEPTEGTPSLDSGMIGLIVIIVILLVVVGLLLLLYCTLESFKNKVDPYLPCKKSTNAANATTTQPNTSEKGEMAALNPEPETTQ